MKMKKASYTKKILSLVLSLMMIFSAVLPVMAVEESEFEEYIGQLEPLTQGLTSKVIGNSTSFEIEEKITLDFLAQADVCQALNTAAWRVLLKLKLSDKLDDAAVSSVHYYEWIDNKWEDSGIIGESDYFIAETKEFIMSVPVELTDLKTESVKAAFAFDWDNSGLDSTLQVVAIELDTEKIELTHSEGCTEHVIEAGLEPTCTESGYTAVSDCSVCGLPVSQKQELAKLEHDFSQKVINDSHLKETVDGTSVYYYECANGDCEEISEEDTFTVDSSEYTCPPAAVTVLTEGLSVDAENPSAVVVTNKETLTLDFSPKDESIGRNIDAWWAGIKITANSSLTAEQLKKVLYRTHFDSWGADKSFWTYKDSLESADEHYITVWVPITTESFEKYSDGFLNVTYRFDWDGNGFGVSTQDITIKIDLSKVELIHSQGHTEVVDTQPKDATCTQAGYTKQSHCSVCGLVISTKDEVKALGHDFSKEILDEDHLAESASCVHYDLYRYGCVRCNVMSQDKFYEDKENSTLLEHEKIRKVDELHLAKPADCENPAWYYMGCKTCDTVFKDDESFSDGTPLYHSWRIEKLTKKASLTSDGEINFFCEDCSAKDDSPIPIAKIESIKLSATKVNYTGKAVTPTVTVKDREGNTLVNKKDYTVKYINSDLPGTATARITFIGNYEGSYDAKYSVEIPVTAKAAFASNNNAIKISWEKVPVAAGYKVYYKTEKGWKALGSTKNTSVTFKNLQPATKFTFAIRSAVIKNGKTYFANSYKTIDTATTCPAPQKLTATQNTSAIKLSWTAVKGADGYAVLLKTQNGWKVLGTTKALSATFTGLASGTNYIYAVRTVNLTASKQKLYGGYVQLTTATKPSTPTVSATTSNGSVSLSWSAVKGASGYQVYYKSEKSNGYVLIDTVSAGTTKLTDTGYTSGSKYVFAVRATKAVQGGYIYGAIGKRTVTVK